VSIFLISMVLISSRLTNKQLSLWLNYNRLWPMHWRSWWDAHKWTALNSLKFLEIYRARSATICWKKDLSSRSCTRWTNSLKLGLLFIILLSMRQELVLSSMELGCIIPPWLKIRSTMPKISSRPETASRMSKSSREPPLWRSYSRVSNQLPLP